MQTAKKNAVSYDLPDYLIRNKNLMLQKDGGKAYFLSKERSLHPITPTKPIKNLNPEYTTGTSQDFTLSTNYGLRHGLTSSLFEKETPSTKIMRASNNHISIKDYIRKSENNSDKYIKLIRSKTPSFSRGGRTPLFKKYLNRSTSKERQMNNSFMNQANLPRLRHRIGEEREETSPYNERLKLFSRCLLTRGSTTAETRTEDKRSKSVKRLEHPRVIEFQGDQIVNKNLITLRTVRKSMNFEGQNPYSEKEVLTYYEEGKNGGTPERYRLGGDINYSTASLTASKNNRGYRYYEGGNKAYSEVERAKDRKELLINLLGANKVNGAKYTTYKTPTPLRSHTNTNATNSNLRAQTTKHKRLRLSKINK